MSEASPMSLDHRCRRTALASAAIELRARQVQPYLQRVADVLVGIGLAEAQDARVQRRDGEVLAAAVALSGSGAPAPVSPATRDGAGARSARARCRAFGCGRADQMGQHTSTCVAAAEVPQ
ncbi:hypothetical protein [Streptomyces sp. NPDC101165]|uniref:hypothetical protein n=1 Tax=Streptomyces sp. NPDC101165 TaxID=3366119 RepID=UPI0038057DFE